MIKKLSKILLMFLCVAIFFSINVYASEISEDGSTTTEFETDVSSRFELLIPKKIHLSSSTYDADYSIVMNYCDIVSTHAVTVSSPTDFDITKIGTADTASVSNDMVKSTNEIENGVQFKGLIDTPTAVTGHMQAGTLSAGDWSTGIDFVVGFGETPDARAAFESSVTASGYSGVYDGEEHSITVTSEGNTVEYSTDNVTFTSENPKYKDAGTYTVYYRVTKSDFKPLFGSQTVVIDKADGDIVAPTSKSLLENGNAQVLVDAGSSSTGTVQYKVGSTGTYSDTLPTGIYTNEYVIYYKSVGDKNHKDTVEQSITSEIKYDTNRALIFSSDNNFTLSVATARWDGILQYSSNNGQTWNTWDGSQLSGTATQPIYLRGSGNSKIWSTVAFTGKYCTGNIENLLDYQTVANGGHPTMGNYCYSYLFNSCTSLTAAPSLPATTLTDSCYTGMFYGCTSLTTAPELPATTLADSCYSSMFNGCTSLTTASELPATMLAPYCYSTMFYGCTSLTTAPELSATTLDRSCCSGMFRNCTSLTTAPFLPATTLAEYCYDSMFYGCTSLTTALTLPATTLAEYCYRDMFYGCTSLTTAPSLPATTLTPYCYESMFSGCTSLTTAPALSAMTLAQSCYYRMFRNCTSLTTAPVLSATKLAGNCYGSMFYGCTSLTAAPALPATTLAQSCYGSMFGRCTALTTAPVLPATTLVDYCYDSMFSDCTSLKISATKTGEYQYVYRIPMTGTGTTASRALTSMFIYTGGTFKGTPTINTTYYATKQPVK